MRSVSVSDRGNYSTNCDEVLLRVPVAFLAPRKARRRTVAEIQKSTQEPRESIC